MPMADLDGLSLPTKRNTLRYSDPPPPPLPKGISVSVNDNPVINDSEDELTYNDDGSVTVNDVRVIKKPKSTKFNANLAEDMDDVDLNSLGSELLELIESDKLSRKEWEETANKGIDLLGLKIEAPSSDTTGGGNISKCKDPLLLEAVLRYQSNFNAEMLPANGPAKIRDDKVTTPSLPGSGSNPGGNAAIPPAAGAPAAPPQPMPPPAGAMPPGAMPPGAMPPPPMGGMAGTSAPPPPMPGPAIGGMGHNGGPPLDDMPQIPRTVLAEAFQKDFNRYLTVVDKPYYSDTDRMSFSQGLFGCAFKKIYNDPLEGRPVSRFVMANHIIVDNGASSLHDAKRITHMTPNMSKLIMKRMMLAGVYRDLDLSTPVSQPDSVDTKIKDTEGVSTNDQKPDDRDFTVFECYCYLDLKGYEHKQKGKVTGLPLPYRVTIEKDSREILEIRRDWKEGDKKFRRRRHLVKYPLFPGLGFYDYGFVHILGNTTRVLSAIESLMVDQGMFANFPGGLIDKSATRQETNQIRPAPGGFKPIDCGGRPINQVVMAMPYKDVSANLMALGKGIQDGARKLGSIAELPLGEGRADVPVGTVIALIEQNTKLLSAVHKRNHAAQQEEFEILKELFAEDPKALATAIPTHNPARQWESEKEFNDINLVPASDPNIASHIMRVAKAQAIVQMAQTAPPGLFDPRKVARRALIALDIEDPDDLFLPVPPPGSQPQVPPPHMIDAQAKLAAIAAKGKADAAKQAGNMQIQHMEMQDHALDRQSKEQIEHTRLAIQEMKDRRELSYQAGQDHRDFTHQAVQDHRDFTHQANQDHRDFIYQAGQDHLNRIADMADAGGRPSPN